MPYHKYHWYDAYSNRFFASAKHGLMKKRMISKKYIEKAYIKDLEKVDMDLKVESIKELKLINYQQKCFKY